MTRRHANNDAALWERYRATRSDEDRNALLEYHWAWTVSHVRGWLRKRDYHQSSLRSLLSVVAQRMLTQAIPNFDPSRGLKFRTFLGHHIVGAIHDSHRTHKWARGRRLFWRISLASDSLSQKLHRLPTESEIAEGVGITEEELVTVFRQAQLAYPSHIIGPTPPEGTRPGHPVIDVLEHRSCTPDLDVRDRFQHFTRGLTAKARLELWLHYYEGYELKDIAPVVGVSAPLVSQHIAESLNFLRKHRDRAESWSDMTG